MFKETLEAAHKYSKKHNFGYNLYTFKKKELWDNNNEAEEHMNWV